MEKPWFLLRFLRLNARRIIKAARIAVPPTQKGTASIIKIWLCIFSE